MKWFRKKHKITPTGRVIDITRPRWGHNISLMDVHDSKGTIKYAIWVSKRPEVGDEIIWASAHGQVKGMVSGVTPASSVWDMSFITVTNVRLDDA